MEGPFFLFFGSICAPGSCDSPPPPPLSPLTSQSLVKFVLESLVVRRLRGSLPQLLQQNKSEGVICLPSTWSHFFWGGPLSASRFPEAGEAVCLMLCGSHSKFLRYNKKESVPIYLQLSYPFMPLNEMIPRGR